MRKLCLCHRLAALFGKPIGETSRSAITKTKPQPPERVDLIDDDDDLMALAKALYPERYQKLGDAK